MVEEVGLCTLQLACTTHISEDENLELYLRKAEKVDPLLGELLGSILRKSVKSKTKMSERELVLKIETITTQNSIEMAKEIKINKFKYVIAKP
jgi:hypothetical protein